MAPKCTQNIVFFLISLITKVVSIWCHLILQLKHLKHLDRIFDQLLNLWLHIWVPTLDRWKLLFWNTPDKRMHDDAYCYSSHPIYWSDYCQITRRRRQLSTRITALGDIYLDPTLIRMYTVQICKLLPVILSYFPYWKRSDLVGRASLMGTPSD